MPDGARPLPNPTSPPPAALTVALLGVLAVLSSIAAQQLDLDATSALPRALVACFGVGVAWSIAGRSDSPARPLSTDPALAWLPVPLSAVAAWCLVQAHLAVPIATVERITMQSATSPWWTFLVGDVGLPSLVHRPLNLLAAQVGGVGLVLCVHAAIYAAVVTLLLDLAVRLTGRASGAALVVAWSTAPAVYEAFAGLRAYPSFLLLLLLAERGMLATPTAPPDDRRVLRALSLAALEIPTALSTWLAYTVGRFTEPHPPRWLFPAAAAFVVAVLPIALAAQQMHSAARRPTGLEWSIALPALLCLTVLADAWRSGWQRAAVTAAAGSIGLVGALVSLGVLDREPRYVYQAGLLPLVLASAWSARRLRPYLGRESASILNGALVLAAACYAHRWTSVADPPSAAWWLTVTLCGLTVLATFAGLSWAKLSSRVLVLATVSLWLTHLEAVELRREAGAGAYRLTARALRRSDRELPLCTLSPALHAHAEAVALTPSWWSPTRYEQRPRSPLREADDPGCQAEALWLGPQERLTACALLAGPTSHGAVLARCPPGVADLTEPPPPR